MSGTGSVRELPLHLVFHVLSYTPRNVRNTTARLLCKDFRDRLQQPEDLLVIANQPHVPPHVLEWASSSVKYDGPLYVSSSHVLCWFQSCVFQVLEAHVGRIV